jgi:hypothetical protein
LPGDSAFTSSTSELLELAGGPGSGFGATKAGTGEVDAPTHPELVDVPVVNVGRVEIGLGLGGVVVVTVGCVGCVGGGVGDVACPGYVVTPLETGAGSVGVPLE